MTPSKPPLPTNNFCLYPSPVLRCFLERSLNDPHHPTSSIFHCYPLPIHQPFPHSENFNHTHTVSRMAPRKSIKCNTNKQIAISSSKPKKLKRQYGELSDDTIFSKLKKEKLRMAKPVQKDSKDCSSSSLDFFLLPLNQSSFQKGKSIDYHPITSLSDGGPIEFKVSGSGKNFSISHAHIYFSKLRCQREMVPI